MKFALKIVGGPSDGIGGLYWIATPEAPPPAVIYIGVCHGDGICLGSKAKCLSEFRGVSHSSYWTDAEGKDARPPDAVLYRRHQIDETTAEATYVIGGLRPVGAEKARDYVSAPGAGGRPLTFAEVTRAEADRLSRLRRPRTLADIAELAREFGLRVTPS